jgi:hypothetical protein
MFLEQIISNFVNPPILFFFLGMFAIAVRSDLDLPQPIPRLLSLYLLMVIGLKGGFELSHSHLTMEMGMVLIYAVFLSALMPVVGFFILRKKLGAANAAGVAATYGSISAVTFITAISFLESQTEEYGGYMVAAMALMESPAIIVGIFLASRYGADSEFDWREIVKDSFFNGSVLLLLGALAIGLLSGYDSAESLQPFTEGIFKGILCLFLLDMGLASARRIGALKKHGLFAIGFAILFPLTFGLLTAVFCALADVPKGDALLLTILCGSASYIAVPAAMRISVPSANPGLYIPMSLAVTFPFNIILGIPMYYQVLNYLGL